MGKPEPALLSREEQTAEAARATARAAEAAKGAASAAEEALEARRALRLAESELRALEQKAGLEGGGGGSQWRTAAEAVAHGKIADELHEEALRRNEHGDHARARILFLASAALRPTLARRASAANMALKMGSATEAKREYEAILAEIEAKGDDALRSGLGEKVKTKLAHASYLCPEDGGAAHAAVHTAAALVSAPAAPSAGEVRTAKRLADVGNAANTAGRTADAQALFLAAYLLGGHLVTRISAASNTSLGVYMYLLRGLVFAVFMSGMMAFVYTILYGYLLNGHLATNMRPALLHPASSPCVFGDESGLDCMTLHTVDDGNLSM